MLRSFVCTNIYFYRRCWIAGNSRSVFVQQFVTNNNHRVVSRCVFFFFYPQLGNNNALRLRRRATYIVTIRAYTVSRHYFEASSPMQPLRTINAIRLFRQNLVGTSSTGPPLSRDAIKHAHSARYVRCRHFFKNFFLVSSPSFAFTRRVNCSTGPRPSCSCTRIIARSADRWTN